MFFQWVLFSRERKKFLRIIRNKSTQLCYFGRCFCKYDTFCCTCWGSCLFYMKWIGLCLILLTPFRIDLYKLNSPGIQYPATGSSDIHHAWSRSNILRQGNDTCVIYRVERSEAHQAHLRAKSTAKNNVNYKMYHLEPD